MNIYGRQYLSATAALIYTVIFQRTGIKIKLLTRFFLISFSVYFKQQQFLYQIFPFRGPKVKQRTLMFFCQFLSVHTVYVLSRASIFLKLDTLKRHVNPKTGQLQQNLNFQLFPNKSIQTDWLENQSFCNTGCQI